MTEDEQNPGMVIMLAQPSKGADVILDAAATASSK
jgi:hypothetical protein